MSMVVSFLFQCLGCGCFSLTVNRILQKEPVVSLAHFVKEMDFADDSLDYRTDKIYS